MKKPTKQKQTKENFNQFIIFSTLLRNMNSEECNLIQQQNRNTYADKMAVYMPLRVRHTVLGQKKDVEDERALDKSSSVRRGTR